MVNPSFNIGQQIGAFEAKRMDKNEITQKNARDMSIIEKALREARYSTDPEVLRGTMSTILTKVSKENQPAAIKFLEDTMKRLDAEEEKALGRQAAAQGGYTYGAHPTVQAQEVRNLQPKQPVGGLTSQPIPPEVSANIENIVQSNPNLTADALTVEFDKSGIPRIYSNAFIENRRRQDEAKSKKESVREDRRGQRDEKLFSSLDDVRQANFLRRGSTETMKNALLTNNLGYFSMDNLAKNVPGLGWLATAGGQSFNAAQKNHLISTIAQLTGRPNQWIEQQIADAYAKIGRPIESNGAAMLFTQFETDAMTKWVEIIDDLDEKGNIPFGNLGKAASKEMEKWFVKEIKNVNKQISQLAKGEIKVEDLFAPDGKVVMYAPDGGLLYVNKEEVEQYKKLGATQP